MAFIYNKKATFNYEIQEKIEAGIELLGNEVKAVRLGRGNLEGSFIIVRGGEAFLIGALISPYQQKNTAPSYDERRNRTLLLHTKEIKRLSEIGRGSGETVVPLGFYAKGRKIKLEIAIVKGKKKHDKRNTIKQRESDREIRRDIKSGR
jgi:SsrA-binding protein